MSICLDNLTVSYQHHPIVHHVSGTFAAGQSTAIVGPNGAGKSTLLKAMMGMISIDAGHVSMPADSAAYLPQRSEIDTAMPMNVFELVSTGLWKKLGVCGGLHASGREKINSALIQVGLTALQHHPIAALSNGQFQRALFARLLVQDASMIILDEPFNAVDGKSTSVLLAIINQWQTQGRTIIAVLHDLTQVRQHFTQTLLLAHEVVAWGKTEAALTYAHLQQANERCSHWYEKPRGATGIKCDEY